MVQSVLMYRNRSYSYWWVVAPLLMLGVLALWGPAAMGSLRVYAAQYTGAAYAFYMDSGHTFYGTVRGIGLNTVTLSDVYSFQTVSIGDTPTSNLTAQQLNPLTAPQNRLVLNWKHVLFFEQLGAKAKVLKIMHGDQ